MHVEPTRQGYCIHYLQNSVDCGISFGVSENILGNMNITVISWNVKIEQEGSYSMRKPVFERSATITQKGQFSRGAFFQVSSSQQVLLLTDSA